MNTGNGLVGAGFILVALTALGFVPAWLGPGLAVLLATIAIVVGLAVDALLRAIREEKGKTPVAVTAAGSEDYCHRCGGPNVNWYAPSPLWNEVMRGGDINARGEWDEIICPTCFAVLTEMAGIATRFRMDAKDVRVPLTLVTPSGRTWDEDFDLWVEPKDASPSVSAFHRVDDFTFESGPLRAIREEKGTEK